MPAKTIETLDVRTRAGWRRWLEKHHASRSEIWLVFHKRHTGVRCLDYDDAVGEALCYGWIDSILRRLDEDRYIRKFTPRKPESRWSTLNRRRYAQMATRGLLAPAGKQRPPTRRSAEAPRISITRLPSYLEHALRVDPAAWKHFQELAPSYRRAYIGWIDSAKRQETKSRRLAEAVRLLAAGKRLGLK